MLAPFLYLFKYLDGHYLIVPLNLKGKCRQCRVNADSDLSSCLLPYPSPSTPMRDVCMLRGKAQLHRPALDAMGENPLNGGQGAHPGHHCPGGTLP